jgi:uncharacterized protein YbaR (Trm112 family)
MLVSMHRYLHCPACHGALALDIFDKTTVGIREGLLSCGACGIVYPIAQHIPRMVPAYLFDASDFCRRHSDASHMGESLRWFHEVRPKSTRSEPYPPWNANRMNSQGCQ